MGSKGCLLEQIVAAFETDDVQAPVSCFAREPRVQGVLMMPTPRQAAVIEALESVGAAVEVSGGGGLVVAAFNGICPSTSRGHPASAPAA